MLINVPVFLLCESFNYGKVIYGKFKACPKSDGKFPYEILIHPETKKMPKIAALGEIHCFI